MEVHGNINMMGNKLVQAGFAMETNFPSNPTPGAVCFKDAVLYFCASIAGNLPVWVPLTKTLEMIRFDIAVPALEWTLVHNLNTNAPFVQVYDHNGLWIIPDYINISVDGRVTVGFSTPTSGLAILQRGATEGLAPEVLAYTQNFVAQTVWVVPHNLGRNPLVRVIVNGQEVQPQSIVFDSTTQLTVTFSSAQTGTVRCV
jgi:hypothetical protein